MGGRISDLPSRQSCGHFCGSNGILWSVPVLMEFQKQSGMAHIAHINRPPPHDLEGGQDRNVNFSPPSCFHWQCESQRLKVL